MTLNHSIPSFVNTMLKLTMLVAISFILLNPVDSQSKQKIDLNANAVSSGQASDTMTIRLLIDKCVMHMNQSNIDSGYYYIDQVCSLSKQLDFKYGVISCFNNKGLLDDHRGNYDSAISNFQEALTLSLESGSNKIIADIYTNLGTSYSNKGDIKKAIENYTIGINTRDDDDLRGKSAGYTNLGIIYYLQGDLSKALEYFLLSLEMDEKLGDKLDIAFSRMNLGVFYSDQEKYDEALNYYTSSYSLCSEISNEECMARSLINIGNIHEAKGKYHDALTPYLNALTFLEEAGNKTDAASASGNIARIYIREKQWDQALHYLEKSAHYNEETGNKSGQASDYVTFGKYYSATGQYEKARLNYDSAVSILLELGYLEQLRNAYYELSQLDSMAGDYTRAYIDYKIYSKYNDSLVENANKERLLDIQSKYETEKKDREIQELKSEKEINDLQFALQRENLNLADAEKNRLQTANLFNLQKIDLLDKAKQLQALELEKNKSDIAAQQANAEQQEARLTLLHQEGEIKDLRLKRKTQIQYYMLGGLFLIILLGAYMYAHYRTRQKLKLQLLRNKIASDLHDDVGSTLSSITIFSEMAKEQSKEAIPLLETIGESSRKMLDAMADIVWTINPENDQFERILLKMRSFAYELLGAKKIAFKFTSDEHVSNIKLPMEVRKNLYLIFKEAANNMAKYSGADKAFFSLKEEKGYLTMLIRDNGKGFDPLQDTIGNGIKNMRKRAEEIRAQFRINSSPGEGTYIELKVAV